MPKSNCPTSFCSEDNRHDNEIQTCVLKRSYLFDPEGDCISKQVLLRFDDTPKKLNELGLWFVEVGKRLEIACDLEDGDGHF